MRKIPILITLLTLLLAPINVAAETTPTPSDPLLIPTVTATPEGPSIKSNGSSVVCLPGVYLQKPPDCTPAGPSLFLTSMARIGLFFPIRALPISSPDPELSKMPATYITASKESIPLFDSLTSAESMSASQRLDAGLKYLSIDERLEQNHFIYYHLRSGEWVEGGSAGTGCCITSGRFQGLVFKQTPPSNFGWFVEEAWSRVAPDYTAASTTNHYYRENVITVYDIRKVGDTEWLMIGPDEWVERRVIKRVLVNTSPPAGVTNNRWIEVNLDEQTLAVYDQGQLVYATLVASGMSPFYTKPGLFQIQQKKEFETMSGSFEANRSDFYYLEDVPWTMYYDQNRALHGAYRRTAFGYPQSHGCINLSPGDAHWLFDWAKESDWVYVWDPSGKTPTDPSFYGPGGA